MIYSINTESPSSIFRLCENNLWGPHSLCRVYYVHDQKVLDLEPLEVACLLSKEIGYRVNRSYGWRFEVSSEFDDWNPAYMSISRCPEWCQYVSKLVLILWVFFENAYQFAPVKLFLLFGCWWWRSLFGADSSYDAWKWLAILRWLLWCVNADYSGYIVIQASQHFMIL